MLKSITTAVLCTICSANLLAQTPLPQNQLRIGVGYVQNYYKDLNFSPLNYRGQGIGGQIEYRRFTQNENMLFAEINVQQANIEADVSRFTESLNISGDISLGYLKRMNKDNSKTQFYLGAVIHSYNNTLFFDGTEAINFYSLHGIDIATQFTQVITPRQRVSLALSVPVFGFLVRPPHTGWDKFIGDNESNPVKIFFRGNWTSIQDFQGINFRANYQYDISPKLSLDAQYRFSFYQTNILKRATLPVNQASLGLVFNL